MLRRTMLGLAGLGLVAGGASLATGVGTAGAATVAASTAICSASAVFAGASESVTVTTPGGSTSTYATLAAAAGAIAGGDTVSVTFSGANASAACPIGLASYGNTSSTFDPNTTGYLFSSQSSGTDAGTLTVTVPPTVNTTTCTVLQSPYPVNGTGANTSGPPDNGAYNPTCSEPGAHGNEPATGSVGKADAKNPPGQFPNGSDANAGYECDRNMGIGQGNPAHTSCSYGGWQVDLFVGPVLDTIGPVSTNPTGFYDYGQPVNRLIDSANG